MNKKILTLLGTLALGTAMAANVTDPKSGPIAGHAAVTKANTKITNVAMATFDDPTTGKPATPVPSNPVVTKVSPKSSFDIVIASNGEDASNDPKYNDVTQVTAQNVANLGPHSETYHIKNYGNTDLVITITEKSTADTTVTYEVVNAKGKAVTVNPGDTVKVPAGEYVELIQKVTAGANAPAVFGATPVGVAEVSKNNTNSSTAQPGDPTDLTADLEEEGKTADTDLQYVAYQVSTISNKPKDPSGKVIVPPTSSGHGDDPSTPIIDKPTTPNEKPGGIQPEVPGHELPNKPTSPDGTPRKITVEVRADAQIAYPPADNDKNPDEVTFSNKVEFTPGTSGILIPKEIDVCEGDVASAVTSCTKTGKTATTKVPGAKPVPVNGKDYWLVTPKPTDTSVEYEVTVPYEDDDNITAGDRHKPVHVDIEVGINAGTPTSPVLGATDVTRDVVMPPNMTFGDDDGGSLENKPDPAPVLEVTDVTVDPNNPGKDYTPGSPISGFTFNPVNDANGVATNAKAVKVGSTVIYEMNIANTGQYADRYKVEGFVEKTADPSTQKYGDKITCAVPGCDKIIYVDENGTELPVDSNGDYVTELVRPGDETKVYAVVQTSKLPLKNTGDTLYLDQTATAYYSGIVKQDYNDAIKLAPKGRVIIAKAQDGAKNTTAKVSSDQAKLIADYNTHYNGNFGVDELQKATGDTIVYGIFAKSEYNVPVENFYVCDKFDPNLRDIKMVTKGNSTTPIIYADGVEKGGNYELDPNATWKSLSSSTTFYKGTAPITAPNVKVVCFAKGPFRSGKTQPLDAGATFNLFLEGTIR